jgi:cytochrome c oxidase subunit 4
MAQNIEDRMLEPHGQAGPEHVHHHVNYYAIFGLLVVLTIITVIVAFMGIEAEWIKVLLALTIASIKAAFVATYFMHLKFEGKMIYVIVAVPLTLTVILVCALIPDIVMTALHHNQLGMPKL